VKADEDIAMLNEHSQNEPAASTPSHRPVGGAILEAQGREIPITETMIQRACRELENVSFQAPRRA